MVVSARGDAHVGRGVGICDNEGRGHIWRNLKKSSSLALLEFSSVWSEGLLNITI